MDKKLLLAMALFLLVLVASDLLFGGPKQERPTPARLDAPADTVTPGTAAPAAEPAGAITEREETPPPQEQVFFENEMAAGEAGAPIVVEGARYRAELDPMGGVVSSYVLEDYTDAEGRPAELVRTPEKGVLGLSVTTEENVVDLSKTAFAAETARDGDWTVVRFRARDGSGVDVSKTYRFHPDSLPFRLAVEVTGVPNAAGDASYAVDWGDGMPILETKEAYDKSGMASVAMLGNDYVKIGGRGQGRFGCGGTSNEDAWEEKSRTGMVRWAGVRNKYFVGAVIPEHEVEGRVVSVRNPGRAIARTTFEAPLSLDGGMREDFLVYLGPMKHKEMAALGVGLERAVDLGMKPIIPVSKAVLWSMTTLYKIIPNYGVVILILSVLTKVIFYPLTKKSLTSMKALQDVKPELERINEKYKDDPQRKNQETMKLYKEKKINPLGGCLPMVVQMPIFFALYSVLYNVIEMRKAPFVFWIKDLSIPDSVGYLSGIPVNPLPIIMTGTMILQQRLTPTDPRQAMMAMLMPVMFLFFFYNLPSGLVFYWTVNNVVSIIQQMWMKRSTHVVSSGKSTQRRDYALASRR